MTAYLQDARNDANGGDGDLGALQPKQRRVYHCACGRPHLLIVVQGFTHALHEDHIVQNKAPSPPWYYYRLRRRLDHCDALPQHVTVLTQSFEIVLGAMSIKYSAAQLVHCVRG